MKYIQTYIDSLANSNKYTGGNATTPDFFKYENVKWMNHPHVWHLSNNSFYRNKIVLKLIKLTPDTLRNTIFKKDQLYIDFINCILINIKDVTKVEGKPEIIDILKKYNSEYNKYLKEYENEQFLAQLDIQTYKDNPPHFVFVTNLVEYFRETYLKIKEILDVSEKQDAIKATEIANHFYAFESLWNRWSGSINKFNNEDGDGVWAHLKNPEVISLINIEYSKLTESSIMSFIKVRADQILEDKVKDIRYYNQYFNLYTEDPREEGGVRMPRAIFLTGPNPNSRIPFEKKAIKGEFANYCKKSKIQIDALEEADIVKILNENMETTNSWFPQFIRNNKKNLDEATSRGDAQEILDKLKKKLYNDVKTLLKNASNFNFDIDGNLINIKKYDYGNIYGPFTEIFGPSESNLDVSKKCTQIINKINAGENVFIIGYGASGAGKTAGLIYFKQAATDVEKDGILLNLLKDPSLKPGGNELNTVVVTIEEFFANDLDKEGNPIPASNVYENFTFVKNGSGVFELSMPDKNGNISSFIRIPMTPTEAKQVEDEAVAKWIESVDNLIRRLSLREGTPEYEKYIGIYDNGEKYTKLEIPGLDRIMHGPKRLEDPRNRGAPNDQYQMDLWKKYLPNIKWVDVPADWKVEGNVFTIDDPRAKCQPHKKKGSTELEWDADCKEPSKQNKPIQIKNLGEFIFTMVDKVRMIQPTPNNDKSSRSHVLIKIKLGTVENTKANYLIFGDLAGVENTPVCSDIETQVDYLSLRLIDPISGEPDDTLKVYDPETGTDVYKTQPNYTYTNKGDFIDFETAGDGKYKRYLSALSYNKKTKTIPQNINDNILLPAHNLSGLIFNSAQMIGNPQLYNIMKQWKLYGEENIPKEIKDKLDFAKDLGIDLTTVIPGFDSRQEFYDKIDNYENQNSTINSTEDIHETRQNPYVRVAKMINPSLVLEAKKVGTYTNVRPPSQIDFKAANKSINTRNAATVRGVLDTFKSTNQEVLKNAKIFLGDFTDQADFNDLKSKIVEKFRELKLLNTGETFTEEMRDTIVKLFILIGENNAIRLSSGIEKFCNRRKAEGTLINRSLEGMRYDIMDIVRGLSSTGESLISNLPLVKGACFKYFCNQNHAYCYTQVKKSSSNSIKTIIDSIRKTIGSTNKISFGVFGVLNLSVRNNQDDPPRLPYLNLLKIKMARDEYLTYQYYGQEQNGREKYLNILANEFYGKNFIDLPLEFNSDTDEPVYGSILHTVYFFIDKINSSIEPLKKVFKEIKNNENLLTTSTKFIQEIERINAVSIMGTIDFMNELKNVFATDTTCSLTEYPQTGPLPYSTIPPENDFDLADDNVVTYKNIVTDNTLASYISSQKSGLGKSIYFKTLVNTVGPGHGLTIHKPRGIGETELGSPKKLAPLPDSPPSSPDGFGVGPSPRPQSGQPLGLHTEINDIIKGGSNHKQALIQEYKQLKKLYKKLKNSSK